MTSAAPHRPPLTIPAGGVLRRCGVPIGQALQPIAAGCTSACCHRAASR